MIAFCAGVWLAVHYTYINNLFVVVCLHVLKHQCVCAFGTVLCICIKAGHVCELCIHEPSSELVKIAQVSCGDSDICIYFEALFFFNTCLCVCVRARFLFHHENRSKIGSDWHSLSLCLCLSFCLFCLISAPFLCFRFICVFPAALLLPWQTYNEINSHTLANTHTRTHTQTYQHKGAQSSRSMAFQTQLCVLVFSSHTCGGVWGIEAEWENQKHEHVPYNVCSMCGAQPHNH